MKTKRRLAISFLAVALIATLCIPVFSFASSNSGSDANGSQDVRTEQEQTAQSDEEAAVVLEPQDISSGISEGSGSTGEAQDPATDCVATIKYYENVTYEDPNIPPDENNRYPLGTRTITGLTEGQVLNAWDYVINLKGFFFFDGWPAKLTVSADPDQNVIELFYGRLWNNSYTVNYYLMENADLSADDWVGALAPDDVTFTKFATATFDNQPFGELVEGDAYEYKIDGAYVVDVYPSHIRVGTETDNDTLNVLYVPESDTIPTLPDDSEIVDGTLPPNIGSGSGSVDMPGDQTFDKDGLVSVLPDSITKDEASELFKDFIGSEEQSSDQIEITDEMAADTVDPEVAKQIIAAYNTGLENGKAAQGECTTTLVDHIVCIIIMIVLAAVAIVFACLYMRERKLRRDLEGTADEQPLPKQE